MDSTLSKMMKDMDQRLSDLEDKMTSIDKKLTQVVDAILGNPLTKIGGFISEIDKMKVEIGLLKNKVAQHEEFKKRIIWTSVVIITISGIVQYLVNLYVDLR